jgi:hypothetical protein
VSGACMADEKVRIHASWVLGLVNAFDLGDPIGTPEPSTWTMMLLGMAGLGFAARRRTRSALAIGKKASASNWS